jgi:glutaredoxin-related protein
MSSTCHCCSVVVLVLVIVVVVVRMLSVAHYDYSFVHITKACPNFRPNPPFKS